MVEADLLDSELQDCITAIVEALGHREELEAATQDLRDALEKERIISRSRQEEIERLINELEDLIK